MKPNNEASAVNPQTSSTLVTTDKGAGPQPLPGVSGRVVAWGLAAFMLFSLIAIPLGLFLYQGVSNQEKQIQRDWPKVAAELELSYAAIDRSWETANRDSNEIAKAHEAWKTARQMFRSERKWWEQMEAAQILEDLLALRSTEEGTTYLDFIARRSTDENQSKGLREARVAALASYAELDKSQLQPYQTALKQFPSSMVLLFFELPQPPGLRLTNSDLLQ